MLVDCDQGILCARKRTHSLENILWRMERFDIETNRKRAQWEAQNEEEDEKKNLCLQIKNP